MVWWELLSGTLPCVSWRYCVTEPMQARWTRSAFWREWNDNTVSHEEETVGVSTSRLDAHTRRSALWLFIPEGFFLFLGIPWKRWPCMSAAHHIPVCVCVCVCVSALLCMSPHLGRGRKPPRVCVSEPLHGHWTQALCSLGVRGLHHTAVRADWSVTGAFQRGEALARSGTAKARACL